MNPELEHFFYVLNLCAIFVAAMSGAAAAIHGRADIFGVAVLAFATACSGGIIRDLLIGDVPPENIRSWVPLAVTLAASIVTLAFFKYLQGFLGNPVQILDAFGLGLFTVLGVTKGMAWNITPVWAILLGVITGVGGGMARDILLARVPNVLHREIYATCSLIGSVVVVVGSHGGTVRLEYAVIAGAVICIVLRCVALRYNWNMPVAKKGQDVQPGSVRSAYKESIRKKKP